MSNTPALNWPWTTTDEFWEEEARKGRVSRAKVQCASALLWVAFGVLMTMKAPHPAALTLLWIATAGHVVLAGVTVWMARKR